MSEIDTHRKGIEGKDSVVLHEEVDSRGKRTQWTARHVFMDYEEDFGAEVVICVERTPEALRTKGKGTRRKCESCDRYTEDAIAFQDGTATCQLCVHGFSEEADALHAADKERT